MYLTSVLDGREFLFHLADAFSDSEDAPKYPLRWPNDPGGGDEGL